jgi:molybdopterin-binding protein
MAPKLALRDVAVRRSGRTILDVPSLEVETGRVLAVIGPNGAGKTTLLLHLALLDRPDSGAVSFDGAPARGRELALRRRMAVVFQQPLLLDRSVLSNVETGLALRGVPRRERRARAERWLARFGVAALAHRSPRTLSGGEAQRVSLARAFALEPEVLLLDEPFSALDAPSRGAITDDLADVLEETAVTTVLVTHDRDEAARLGDVVAVIIGGRIRQLGPPSDVFSAPADEDVAAFVGVENMLPGRVTSRAEGLVTLAVGDHEVEAVSTGDFDRALVCLRPEDVSLAPRGEQLAGSARNKLIGRVTRVTATGADARVEVDCGFPLVARITRRSLDDLGVAPGVELVASFKATAVHLIRR